MGLTDSEGNTRVLLRVHLGEEMEGINSGSMLPGRHFLSTDIPLPLPLQLLHPLPEEFSRPHDLLHHSPSTLEAAYARTRTQDKSSAQTPASTTTSCASSSATSSAAVTGSGATSNSTATESIASVKLAA